MSIISFASLMLLAITATLLFSYLMYRTVLNKGTVTWTKDILVPALVLNFVPSMIIPITAIVLTIRHVATFESGEILALSFTYSLFTYVAGAIGGLLGQAACKERIRIANGSPPQRKITYP